MLYALLFTFYINGSHVTVHAGDLEDKAECKQKAYEIYKMLKHKPVHMMCARKA
jgi:hypothetical protein